MVKKEVMKSLQAFHKSHQAFHIVGEPNSRILQNNATLALEIYTADFLCVECLNTAWYETTV